MFSFLSRDWLVLKSSSYSVSNPGNAGNFCCSNLGADWWEVARPYSVWGKFFSKKFKAELQREGH